MTIYYTKGEETITEDELYQRFRDYLDENYEEAYVDAVTFSPSRVLEELDSIAFEDGFDDWTDRDGWEKTDIYGKTYDSEGMQGFEVPNRDIKASICELTRALDVAIPYLRRAGIDSLSFWGAEKLQSDLDRVKSAAELGFCLLLER